MDIYRLLKELSKSVRAQNRFLAAKEVNGIHLFKNLDDFSKIQEVYLSYLYSSSVINNDIIMEKISEHVFDSEIMEDAYLLWKRKVGKKINTKPNKKNDVNLVVGKNIKFPTKGTK